MSLYTIVAFYKFTRLTNLEVLALQTTLKALCKTEGILGTIILAKEGINSTVAGSASAIKTLIDYLQAQPPFSDLVCKYSVSDTLPFHKTKVLIKKEIVTLGIPNVDPIQKTGIEVAPEDWNALISDPDVIVIDTRNTYEVEMGTFQNALNPKTDNFRDFPTYVAQQLAPHKDKKIAMFCTGGIRCEKGSALLLEQGFTNVYQLKGGILKYLEKIPTEESTWEGECFIFDDRVTLKKDAIR